MELPDKNKDSDIFKFVIKNWSDKETLFLRLTRSNSVSSIDFFEWVYDILKRDPDYLNIEYTHPYLEIFMFGQRIINCHRRSLMYATAKSIIPDRIGNINHHE